MARKRKVKKISKTEKKRKGIVLFLLTLAFLGVVVAFKTVEAQKLKKDHLEVYTYGNSPTPSKSTKIIVKPRRITHAPRDQSYLVPQDLGNGMVAIPELGIKFPLPEEINDLIYYQGYGGVLFSTKSLTALEPNYCAAASGPLGALSKIYKSDLTPENPSGNWRTNESALKELTEETINYFGTVIPPQVKEFEDYYLLYEGPQYFCLHGREDSDSGVFKIGSVSKLVSQTELTE